MSFTVAAVVCTLVTMGALSTQAQYAPFRESMDSLGLLGSHFGQVDLPATYDYIVVGGGE